MSPLKEALILIKEMPAKELEFVQVFTELCLELRSEKPSALQELGAAAYEYRKAKAAHQHEVLLYQPHPGSPDVKPKAKKKTKAKTPKPFDAGEVLAKRSGGRQGGVTTGRPSGKVLVKVLDSLNQTSGKITAADLAEVLEMDHHSVSSCLSNAIKNKSAANLRRKPGKTTLDSGKTVPTFLYWLEAK